MDSTNMSDSYVKRKMELREEHLPFDVESWFPLIQDLTFPTSFINVSPQEAEAMRAFYSARYTGRRHEFTLEHVHLIKQVMKSLEDVLTAPDSKFKSQGAFVRFSSRSPKDGAPFQLIQFEEKFQSFLQKVSEEDAIYEDNLDSTDMKKYEEESLMNANLRMRAFCLASSQTWRVRNANEAMNLILSSTRFYVDLSMKLFDIIFCLSM